MFDEKETTLQRICALMLWSHRVASAATDVAIGTSLNPNPVGELEEALQRVQGMAHDWIRDINPRYGRDEQSQSQGSMQAGKR